MNQQQTTHGKRRSLYTRPQQKQFDAKVPGELLSYLQTLDNNTSLRPIYDASEVQLDESAKMIRDGFQFTASAFRQAAQILAPGLSKFLPDIAGTAGQTTGRSSLVDGQYAIKMWNNLVDLRFPLFERYRIIRNDHEKTIEGFVRDRKSVV